MDNFYKIKGETLISLADQARRINGTTDDLTTTQMLEIFEGAGQGGSDDVIDNGVTVRIFDENGTLVQKYEMESGFTISSPFYTTRGWIYESGQGITFPLRVTESVDIYANGKTYAKSLYDAFGVKEQEYPYLKIYVYSSKLIIIFGYKVYSVGTTAYITGNEVEYSASETTNILSDDTDTFISNICANVKTNFTEEYNTKLSRGNTVHMNFNPTDLGFSYTTEYVDLNQ